MGWTAKTHWLRIKRGFLRAGSMPLAAGAGYPGHRCGLARYRRLAISTNLLTVR